ncbi:hypothetical protein C0J52_06850 [Blattella germanica]|nr:hypothetical protein C0J52_06850 [Blattella germanica]
MEVKKRARGTNFSNAEKEIFVNLLPKYFNIIDNKKTDGVSIRQKEACWEQLTTDFNTHALVTKRTSKQLKVFYDGYKRQCKTNFANEKIELFKSGGGAPKFIQMDETSAKLLSIIKEQIQPGINCKDSDASFHLDYFPNATESTTPVEPVIETAEVTITMDGGETHDGIISVDVPIMSVPFTPTSVLDNDEHTQHAKPEAPNSWFRRNRPLSAKRKVPESVIAGKKIVF